ncbi:hypothetical protein ACHAW5_002596 [Stephanodiscus triporus]|uniref:UBC core domain-containing protein n=1 Tax=Stephanodiscus triporus TaxID=2934178 RepID=A0ABD3PKB2_9STRA
MPSSLCKSLVSILVSAPSSSATSPLFSSVPTPIVRRKKKNRRNHKSSVQSEDATKHDNDSIDAGKVHNDMVIRRRRSKGSRSQNTSEKVEKEESNRDIVTNDDVLLDPTVNYESSFEEESFPPADHSLAAIAVQEENCCIVLGGSCSNNDRDGIVPPDDNRVGRWQKDSALNMTSSSPSIFIQTAIEKYGKQYINASSRGERMNTITNTGCDGVGQPVQRIVNVSQYSQERTINSDNIIKDGDGSSIVTRKKKKSLLSFMPATTGSGIGIGSGKDGDCLRRIKREWKEVVQMGLAYDWTNMKTINDQRNKISDSVRSTNNDRDYLRIGPFNKNMLRWHFSVAGPPNSVYENGVYHGLILLPRNYPAMPPRIQMLTPNGRFLTNVDICLSASNYHPETWTPKWTILSLVNALRLHMLTLANEIGGMMSSDERRRWYAKESRVWRQSYCYPGGSGSGEGVVVIDHVQMVASGIFTPAMTTTKTTKDYDDSLSRRIGNEGNNNIEQDSSAIELKDLACYTEGESAVINDDMFLASSCTQTQPKCILPNAVVISPASSRAAKIKQKKKKSSTMIESKVAKAVVIASAPTKDYGPNKGERTVFCLTTLLGREPAPKKNATTEQQRKGRIISNIIMFNRQIVEVLKLPLQILFAVLKVLGDLESRLREIIDSLISECHLFFVFLVKKLKCPPPPVIGNNGHVNRGEG